MMKQLIMLARYIFFFHKGYNILVLCHDIYKQEIH